MPFIRHHISHVPGLSSVLEVHIVSDEGNLETFFSGECSGLPSQG